MENDEEKKEKFRKAYSHLERDLSDEAYKEYLRQKRENCINVKPFNVYEEIEKYNEDKIKLYSNILLVVSIIVAIPIILILILFIVLLMCHKIYIM